MGWEWGWGWGASGKTQEPYSDSSTETTEDRRQRKDVSKVLKENNCCLKNLYTANTSFKNEGGNTGIREKLKRIFHQGPHSSSAPSYGATGDRSKPGKSEGKSMGTRMLGTGLKLSLCRKC